MSSTGPALGNTVKAALVSGVTIRTIYAWLAAGKIAFVTSPGGHRMILLDSLPRAR